DGGLGSASDPHPIILAIEAAEDFNSRGHLDGIVECLGAGVDSLLGLLRQADRFGQCLDGSDLGAGVEIVAAAGDEDTEVVIDDASILEGELCRVATAVASGAVHASRAVRAAHTACRAAAACSTAPAGPRTEIAFGRRTGHGPREGDCDRSENPG